mmetsp:Transcript_8632/g.20469  ORF Transcript_8632/g.20469 Transcript_8632/m.20469 type:complete len:187 (+) Transcript_8632:67-627(+)
MGASLSLRAPPRRVLMVGLDAAGKTTLLYRWKAKADDVQTTVPTIGLNVETCQLRGLDFSVYDVGGGNNRLVRMLSRHYVKDVHCLVFVVDANDTERIEEARDELASLLGLSEADGVPLVVIANKQDLPNAVCVDNVVPALRLETISDRQWFVLGTCAVAANDGGHDDALHTIATLAASDAGRYAK